MPKTRRWQVMQFAAVCVAAHTGAAHAETLIGPYPFAVGDKFVYAYSSTDSVQIGSGTPTVTTTAYTATTKILAPVQYDYPPSGGTVTAYPVVTTASWSTAAGTHTLKTTEYQNFVTSGNVTGLLVYGYLTTTDLAEPNNITLHNSLSRVYGMPGVLDELPQTTGATFAEPVAWTELTNNYYITSAGNSNVLTQKYVRKATGAYTATGMNFDVPFTIVQAANGTGTNSIGPSTSPEVWSFARPEKSASGEIIPVTVTYDGQTGVNDATDWYPGGGAPANPLTTNAAADKGIVAIPAGCGKYAGQNARLIELSYGHLDTVGGYTLYETDSYYIVNKIGAACLTVNYTRTAYDQKVTGNESYVDTFSSSAGLLSKTVK